MYIDFHTHLSKNEHDIKNYYPSDPPYQGNFSIGIHPWFISENWQEAIEQVSQKSKLPNCKAIGECGLDKNTSTPFELQIQIFEEHIRISEDIQKPLIIHCVKSFSEIISIKKRLNPKQIWILHGFQKNNTIAEQLLKNGIKLSFGKAIVTNASLEILIKKIQNSDFLIETDDSNIDITILYQKIAHIRNISVKELQQIQYENYQKIFSLGQENL